MQPFAGDPLVTRMTPKQEPYPDGEAAREIARAIRPRGLRARTATPADEVQEGLRRQNANAAS